MTGNAFEIAFAQLEGVEFRTCTLPSRIWSKTDGSPAWSRRDRSRRQRAFRCRAPSASFRPTR